MAFLAALFVSPLTAVIMAAVFSLLIILARRLRPDSIRGIGGSGRRSRSLAEVWFPVVALPVFGISWLWLNQPGAAVASLLFMAWGDGITGLVRWRCYCEQGKGWLGSLAMFGVCLAVSAALIRPIWIGLLASLGAVAAERLFGDVGKVKRIDDNLAVPVISLGIILALMYWAGLL